MNLSTATVKRLHAEGPDWFRPELETFFGKDFFKPKDFREIKTLADAAEQAEYTPEYLVRDDSESIDEWAYRMIKMVVKAINQGWTTDWNNGDQRKWYPLFEVTPDGVGFSGSDCYDTYTYAGVGSRLCFESSEKCKYAAQQFADIYKQFLL